MKTNWIRGLMIPGLLLASAATTQANDIVKFFNAINGGSRQRNAPPAVQPVGHHDHGGAGMNAHGTSGYGYGGRELTSRDIYKLQTANRATGHGGYGDPHVGGSPYAANNRVDLRDHNFGRTGYGRSGYVRPSGTQIRFQVSANSGIAQSYGSPLYIPGSPQIQQLPPVQTLPSVQDYPPIQSYPPVPGYPPVQSYPPIQGGQFNGLPHQIGEIVDCPVPLATCVRVEDACNIAPNAVPVVVAVRDPNMCAHECQERLAYVQVFVPPCPPRSISISPCHTRVTLCFGRYDVEIKSRNGVIVVDYDD